MKRSELVGAACVAGAAMLWGLWPLWVRGAAGGAATAVIAQLVAGLVALPLAIVDLRRRGGWPRPAGGEASPRAALVGIVALGLANAANTWLYFRALAEGAVAPAALSHYLAPVLVALAAPTVLGEPRSSRTPIALALALAGTAGLLFSAQGAGASAAAARHAALLGGGSAIFYASATLIAKKAGPYCPDLALFAGQSLVAALATWTVVELPPLAAWLRPSVGGLVSTMTAGLVFFAGLRRLPAERVGVLSYLEVAASILVGWIALGEAPGPMALVGGAGILAAGLLVLSAPRA